MGVRTMNALIVALLRASSAFASSPSVVLSMLLTGRYVKDVKAVKQHVKSPRTPQIKRWRGFPSDVKRVKAGPRVYVHTHPRAHMRTRTRAGAPHASHPSHFMKKKDWRGFAG